MNYLRTTTISLLLMLFCIDASIAQDTKNVDLPTAFMIGEYEDAYNEFTEMYPESLLQVSHDSMELAYINWMYLLKDMEDHAKVAGFELNGLKIWINVFWNKNGKIDYISFYPKPNSRNMDFNQLTAFFIDFIKKYKSRLSNKENFVHYGSARFPSFADMYIPKSK